MKMSDMPDDALYDALKTVPPRPTISNLQWIMGTQYISPADLNLLSTSPFHYSNDAVGGPDRPLSKSQAAAQYAQDRQRALADRAVQRSNTGSSQESPASQGIFAQMSQSLSERGAKLGGVQETFNQLGDASAEWYNSMTKTVEQQKRKALLGSVTGKLNPF
jgi:syntaxin-binding protein 5